MNTEDARMTKRRKAARYIGRRMPDPDTAAMLIDMLGLGLNAPPDKPRRKSRRSRRRKRSSSWGHTTRPLTAQELYYGRPCRLSCRMPATHMVSFQYRKMERSATRREHLCAAHAGALAGAHA